MFRTAYLKPLFGEVGKTISFRGLVLELACWGNYYAESSTLSTSPAPATAACPRPPPSPSPTPNPSNPPTHIHTHGC